MLEQGFEVTPLAGSAGLARIAQAGPWAALEILQGLGHSYEQEERTWLQVTARKADHQRMQP